MSYHSNNLPSSSLFQNSYRIASALSIKVIFVFENLFVFDFVNNFFSCDVLSYRFSQN